MLFATIFEPWQILYALPVFAIGWGGIIPVRPSFQAEYFGMKAFGAIQGLIFTIATLGGLVGPVFAGWMYDETESYRLAFVILSAEALLAVPLTLTMQRPRWDDTGFASVGRCGHRTAGGTTIWIFGGHAWRFPALRGNDC